MQTTRRSFVAGGIASLCALPAMAKASAADEAQGDNRSKKAQIGCLDFGLSFVCNPSPANAVRFWIESRTTVIDEATGEATEFYQCASCKSENTFSERDLFKEDNYDFLPIFGGRDAEDLLVFRRPAQLSDRYRAVTKSEDVWGKPILRLRQGKPVRVLDSWEKIHQATASGVPIVTLTEISNPDTKLRAIIECPVKTMNISIEQQMYQVDTGPIAFPDLTRRYDPLIEGLSLAFVAFNAPQFADFIVEQPMPVVEDDKELCKVYHYCNPFSLAAKNTVLAVGAG